MHLWRNRQTRQIQVLVGATRCRFDSCQVHQTVDVYKRQIYNRYVSRRRRVRLSSL